MMTNDPNDPVTTLDTRFSTEGAPAVPWPEARQALEDAGTYWLSTVRSDGRPHVTTLIAIWNGDALYFSSGPAEQKCKNLEKNPHCILTTGCNHLDDGLDVVVEGEAVRVNDDAKAPRAGRGVGDEVRQRLAPHRQRGEPGTMCSRSRR